MWGGGERKKRLFDIGCETAEVTFCCPRALYGDGGMSDFLRSAKTACPLAVSFMLMLF